jgi:hypothetical protein
MDWLGRTADKSPLNIGAENTWNGTFYEESAGFA